MEGADKKDLDEHGSSNSLQPRNDGTSGDRGNAKQQLTGTPPSVPIGETAPGQQSAVLQQLGSMAGAGSPHVSVLQARHEHMAAAQAAQQRQMAAAEAAQQRGMVEAAQAQHQRNMAASASQHVQIMNAAQAQHTTNMAAAAGRALRDREAMQAQHERDMAAVQQATAAPTAAAGAAAQQQQQQLGGSSLGNSNSGARIGFPNSGSGLPAQNASGGTGGGGVPNLNAVPAASWYSGRGQPYCMYGPQPQPQAQPGPFFPGMAAAAAGSMGMGGGMGGFPWYNPYSFMGAPGAAVNTSCPCHGRLSFAL